MVRQQQKPLQAKINFIRTPIVLDLCLALDLFLTFTQGDSLYSTIQWHTYFVCFNFSYAFLWYSKKIWPSMGSKHSEPCYKSKKIALH